MDAEIKNELREAQRETGPDGHLDDALGKTVPRESDKELLAEFDSEVKHEKTNDPALS